MFVCFNQHGVPNEFGLYLILQQVETVAGKYFNILLNVPLTDAQCNNNHLYGTQEVDTNIQYLQILLTSCPLLCGF